MLHILRSVVGDLTTISVIVSLVTYYLAANKQWQVKHERAVAASISITSNGLYLITTTFFALNMVLTSAPWQTMAETAFSLLNTVFAVLVGLSFWVPGERRKGFFRLLAESLRSERKHLGALAKAFTHASGARKIVDILTEVAFVDGAVEDKEKAFIKVFADAWDIRIDWAEAARRAATKTDQRYAQLRRDVEAYLAVSPPTAQALQLADLIARLVNADEKVTDEEALISAELGALLEQYAGKRDKVVYEVHLVPQSAAQDQAMAVAFPQMKRRMMPSGPVAVAATCYSPEYAEIVRAQLSSLNFYTAVTRVDVSSEIEAAPAAA
jgi:hypothetical protein